MITNLNYPQFGSIIHLKGTPAKTFLRQFPQSDNKNLDEIKAETAHVKGLFHGYKVSFESNLKTMTSKEFSTYQLGERDKPEIVIATGEDRVPIIVN